MTDGSFILVTFEIENLGNEQTYFPGTVADLVGANRRAYSPSDNVDALIALGDQYGNNCASEQFNAGLIRECIVLYEVPADAEITGVNAGDINNAYDGDRQTIPVTVE